MVAMELGAYLVICETVRVGQLVRNLFLTALVHVEIVGENMAAW